LGKGQEKNRAWLRKVSLTNIKIHRIEAAIVESSRFTASRRTLTGHAPNVEASNCTRTACVTVAKALFKDCYAEVVDIAFLKEHLRAPLDQYRKPQAGI
jgi:hypothetical protein